MGKPSDYDKHLLSKKEWWRFVIAVGRHGHSVLTLLSGLGLIWIVEKIGFSLPPVIVPWVVAFSVVVGAFIEWFKSRRAKEKTELKLIAKQAEYDANQKAWRELYDPKIVLSCGNDVTGSRLEVAGGYDFDSAFRIKIESKGFAPLVNCRGNLIEVNRGGQVIFSGQEAKLTFAATGHYPPFQQLDVGIPAYLEVFGVKGGKLRAAVNHHDRSLGRAADLELQLSSCYEVKVVIAVFNSIAVEAILNFIWTGDFQTSSLTLISQRPLTGPI